MARAAWPMMGDRAIPDDVRFAAALDLAHAARLAGDLVQFTRATRVVLRFAPQAEFPAVAREMARMWPKGAATVFDRAS